MAVVNFRKKCRVIGISAFLLFAFPLFLQAADSRSVGLDLYLIVDGSEGFQETKDESVAWINAEIIDRLLQEGDRLVIWSAGSAARIIHSETLGPQPQKEEAKNKLLGLEPRGKGADFAAALRDAVALQGGTVQADGDSGAGKRIAYTLVVSGSVEALAPSLRGGSAGLFRWSRAVKYAGWQAFSVAPGLGEKIRPAAAAYMSGL